MKRRRFNGPTRRALSRALFAHARSVIFADTNAVTAWATGQTTVREMVRADARISLALDVAKHGSRAALSQAIRIMHAVSADPGGPAVWASEGANMRRILGFDTPEGRQA